MQSGLATSFLRHLAAGRRTIQKTQRQKFRQRDTMDTHDTLDAAGAAALLNADAETVLLLARRGELPGTKIGKSWVFLRIDLLDFLSSKVRADTARRRKQVSEPAIPTGVLLVTPQSRRRRKLPVLPQLPGAELSAPTPVTTSAVQDHSPSSSHNALTGVDPDAR